ncbi:TPA: hypothetical protein RI707_003466 [Vibrio cholerae]|uniref:hypothetical protein n=1 Tax=Vibrio cholerae TaxID=666 RepID=UPI002853BD7C|nr:hypothetical protein [Vibrio cholerae]HDV5298619.1 hypothetical protein [Vibrio cholerae]HDV5306129.1 hypothetical protein [Vibrio cholerae]HDV5309791.1 hypothetical protein [Vibrio cholerae]HDV5313453.1 hypothetical protein [Vibrio cholerae]
MKYKIPANLNLKDLPILTQYHLDHLLTGKNKPVNVSKQRSTRLIKGEIEEGFEIGLAVRLYILIKEYNEPLKSDEV